MTDVLGGGLSGGPRPFEYEDRYVVSVVYGRTINPKQPTSGGARKRMPYEASVLDSCACFQPMASFRSDNHHSNYERALEAANAEAARLNRDDRAYEWEQSR